MLEVEDGVVPATVMGVVEVVEVEAAAAEVMTMTMTTMRMMTKTPRLRPWRDRPDVDVGDEPTGSSTTPRCNNNWPKSYKINVKRPRVDA